MCPVERYWLDIFRITSKHTMGSGTNLVESGWTLFISGVVPDYSTQTSLALGLRLQAIGS